MSKIAHGKSRTPEHNIWKTMRQRCYNSNIPSYTRYGARGITMCKRWKDSFLNFLKDMGERPTPKHSIDRIDNNKGYSKSNCRWATMKEQCANRRNNRFITFNGDTKHVSEWCKLYGLTQSAIYCRLNRKWSYERIFSTPMVINNKKGVKYKYKGEEMNLSGWSKAVKIDVATLRQRIKRGYSIEDAFTKKVDKSRL